MKKENKNMKYTFYGISHTLLLRQGLVEVAIE